MGPAESRGAALSRGQVGPARDEGGRADERALRWLMGLAAAGVAVSAYLTVLHVAIAGDPERSLCTFGTRLSCDRVLSSPYATLGGVPLAVIGLLGFAVMLALATWRFVDRRPATRWTVGALFFGSTLAFGFEAALTATAVASVGAACPFCLVVLALTAVAATAAWRLRGAAAESPAPPDADRRGRRRVLAATAAGGAGLLAALLALAWLQIGSAGDGADGAPGALALGQVAPPFQARGADGRLHHLGEYLGAKPVLLEFLWTSCGHCRAMAPTMRELSAAYGDRLTILSIAGDPRDRERLVRDFAREYGHEWPYLLAGPRLLVAYGVTGYPTVVVLDRGGRVRATVRGEASLEALEQAVEAASAPAH